MCFIVTSRSKIATKNIVCYKKSNQEWGERKAKFTPYFKVWFSYTVNKPTEKVRLRNYGGEIDEGYHSYKDVKRIEYSSYRLGKFVIPKGARYYDNGSEYVSETLIFKGWLTKTELKKLCK